MLEKITFSSDALPPGLNDRARFDLWRDIHTAEIASLDYAISDAMPFMARLETRSLGKIAFGTMSGTINRAERTVKNISEDDGEGYCLFVNSGHSQMSGSQLGREFSISSGAAVLVSNSEPIKMAGGDQNVWMSVLLPDATLGGAFAGIDDRLALQIGADSEALGLLKRYCQFLEAGAPLRSPDLIAHASDTIIDLVGLATGVKGRDGDLAGSGGLRAARLAAVAEIIAVRFIDPAFSAQTIARELGLSTRYIHDLLQESGIGLAERVLELRLQKTRVMLADRRNDIKLVSEIAISCGFSDISYFNRSFRRRFGCTPGSVR